MLTSKTEYKNGKKHGWSYVYTKGKITTENYYEDGLQNGTYKTYSTSGELIVESNYKNDQRHGLFTMYANGVKSMDFIYENGEKHGVSHMYKPDGSVIFEHWFVLGEKVSKVEFDKYLQKHNN